MAALNVTSRVSRDNVQRLFRIGGEPLADRVRGGGGWACAREAPQVGQEKKAVSYVPEIVAYGEPGYWSPSGLRFGTREEAEAYVRNLARRWTLVIDTRVVESEEAPNYQLLGRKPEARA
jgi:hypothetical protein